MDCTYNPIDNIETSIMMLLDDLGVRVRHQAENSHFQNIKLYTYLFIGDFHNDGSRATVTDASLRSTSACQTMPWGRVAYSNKKVHHWPILHLISVILRIVFSRSWRDGSYFGIFDFKFKISGLGSCRVFSWSIRRALCDSEDKYSTSTHNIPLKTNRNYALSVQQHVLQHTSSWRSSSPPAW